MRLEYGWQVQPVDSKISNNLELIAISNEINDVSYILHIKKLQTNEVTSNAQSDTWEVLVDKNWSQYSQQSANWHVYSYLRYHSPDDLSCLKWLRDTQCTEPQTSSFFEY